MAKTYNDIFIDAKRRLKSSFGEGSAEEINAAASVEARMLLAFAAGKTVNEFVRDMRLYASPEYEAKAEEVISRREGGEPTAYISGGWEFYGLPMIVSPDVLIPRVDTEVVVEQAIGLIKNRVGPRVLDLCTGSGCIGIAIAKNVPEARVVLADISAPALKTARQNTVINKVSARCMCVQADALRPPEAMLTGFDLIVCNPPYIPGGDIAALDSSVRNFEPHLALDGGEDGLDFYRAVCKDWTGALNEGGYLVFECGIGQCGDVMRLGIAQGLSWLGSVFDTIGVERAAVFGK